MSVDIDNLIKCLYDKSLPNDPYRLTSMISQREILGLCKKVREVFMEQKMLLELSAPITICGDIHGQLEDLLEIFWMMGTPSKKSYLFLGDYVDRGRQSLECICLLFAFKLKYPSTIFLLRGNHEEAGMNKIYGFYDECKRRFSIKMWKTFVDVFDCMPVAAVVGEKIFCSHGGISPSLKSFDQIRNLKRPCTIPDKGLLCDLLWSDPRTECPRSTGWQPNVDRGISFTFGEDVVQNFIETFHMDLICRAHEVVQDGYEFFADKRLVTVFSAPLYTGQYDNDGAILNIDENLCCRVCVMKPVRKPNQLVVTLDTS